MNRKGAIGIEFIVPKLNHFFGDIDKLPRVVKLG